MGKFHWPRSSPFTCSETFLERSSVYGWMPLAYRTLTGYVPASGTVTENVRPEPTVVMPAAKPEPE